MSSDNDIFGLWNQQKPADSPALSELIGKAKSLRTKTRNKLIGAGLLLLATAIFIGIIAINLDSMLITTRIGIGLVLFAIALNLVFFTNTISTLFKAPIDASSKEYLDQLIKLRQKQDFMQRTLLSIYFILLSVGIFLYMIQFAMKMGALWAIITYAVTAAWFAFSWFYLRPRTIKKQQLELNGLIEEFERMDKQLAD